MKLPKLYTKIPPSQKKHPFSMIRTNHSMLLTEIIAVYCEGYTDRMNVMCKQNTEFLGKMLSFVIVTLVTKYRNITEF